MSHFTVLVVGNNAEEQLAAYDENMNVEPYPHKIDNDSVEFFATDRGIAKDAENFLPAFSEWYGEEVTCKDGAYYYESTYNPRSKWDWYALGGRWTGFFKLKPGKTGIAGTPGVLTAPALEGYADCVIKGNIDIQGMRDETEAHARTLWLTADPYLTPEARAAFKSYEQLFMAAKPAKGESAHDLVRAKYFEQDLLKQLREAFPDGFNKDPEFFTQPLETVVEKARLKALSTYAYVKDGEWFGRGEMGWFGISKNEVLSELEWLRAFNEMLDSLPDDTLLSVYDCHI